jgi:hypothetical protein
MFHVNSRGCDFKVFFYYLITIHILFLSDWDCGAPPVIANAYIHYSREELPADIKFIEIVTSA